MLILDFFDLVQRKAIASLTFTSLPTSDIVDFGLPMP